MQMDDRQVEYRVKPTIANEALNALFADAWQGHQTRDFSPVLARSLSFICAYSDPELVGFVNIAWDGGRHAFLLDTTVRTDMRRRGIGTELVRRAVSAAREKGAEWLHVDYEPRLDGFYRGAGFRETKAGLIRLAEAEGNE
jgi:ribosomal protein S18 acetylase RimI-like enzyme